MTDGEFTHEPNTRQPFNEDRLIEGRRRYRFDFDRIQTLRLLLEMEEPSASQSMDCYPRAGVSRCGQIMLVPNPLGTFLAGHRLNPTARSRSMEGPTVAVGFCAGRAMFQRELG